MNLNCLRLRSYKGFDCIPWAQVLAIQCNDETCEIKFRTDVPREIRTRCSSAEILAHDRRVKEVDTRALYFDRSCMNEDGDKIKCDPKYETDLIDARHNLRNSMQIIDCANNITTRTVSVKDIL